MPDTDATDRALARIERHNAELHAFTVVAADTAREEARHYDTMVALGQPPGLLQGWPVGIKDIIDVAGLPTQGGSLSRAGAAPAVRDATVVRRLRNAGAVIAGKTHTVEYAFGGWGTNVSLGTPRNPWDRTTHRVPGGSSSGSAVAVAAGLVRAALGTDTGGSVRVPASFCGLVGLKTTAGLLPLDDILTLSSRFDTVGPMTQCVADNALLFAALLAEDAPRIRGGDAFMADPLGALAGGVDGMRIGVLDAPEVPLHPDTARVFAETQSLLIRLGAILSPVRLPRPMTGYVSALNGLIALHGYRTYETLMEEEPNRIGAPVRARMRFAKTIPATWLLAELDIQTAEIAAVATQFRSLDAILTPASPFPAPPLAEVDEATSPAMFTRCVNYLDLAAVSMPMGLSGEGMPVGMQIVVPGFHEVRALRIAAALEQARPVAVALAFD